MTERNEGTGHGSLMLAVEEDERNIGRCVDIDGKEYRIVDSSRVLDQDGYHSFFDLLHNSKPWRFR